jgi:hypothetical protein
VFSLSYHRFGYLEKIKGSGWHSNHESNRFYHTTGRFMITEAELKVKGVKALSDAFGPVDTERFVSLMQKNVFDYTSWQKTLFEDLTLDELNDKAKESWGKKKN